MEFSKSAERKYFWNFNNGSLRRQQKKIYNSFTSFHHTAYLENITNSRRLQSTNQALPPIPYIIPKHIKVLHSFLNYSNPSCKANPNVPPHKNISKVLENTNLVNKPNAIRNFKIESIPKGPSEQLTNPSKKNEDQDLRFKIKNEINHSLKSQKSELEKNYEVLQEDEMESEEKNQNSNSLSSNESLKQNELRDTIMKNLINQLTCAEQLFQKSHEENQKKIEPSKLSTEKGDSFQNNLSDDSDRAKEMISKPLMSKKISDLRRIFEQKESQETIPNSNYSSSSSYHNHVNINRNSKHVDLSKLSGNGEAAKIKHSACLNSAIIDKIKEKVFSASQDSNNNQNYILQNNALKFPKETSMAMKLLLNKRMVGLNENNININSEQIRTKKKLILKCDPNFPCHKNLLCTKGSHSGRCDVRRSNSTKLFKNCQASWLHSNNYYEGDLDLLNNCLNLAFQTN